MRLAINGRSIIKTPRILYVNLYLAATVGSVISTRVSDAKKIQTYAMHAKNNIAQ
jgi:hypothetical protein